MTEIVLSVIILAGLVAWLYRERENAKERADRECENAKERAALADRIQAPFAAQAAAMENFGQPAPEVVEPDLYTEEVPRERHNDLALQVLLGEDE